MKFSVVELYRDGIKRPRDEVCAATPAVGELTISPWPMAVASASPLAAHLKENWSGTCTSDVLLPIFEIRITQMTARSFRLRGIQINLTEAGTRETVQEWWVRTA